MSELFIRKPSGDSEWTEEASALCNSFAQTIRDTLVEAEEDGPIDLRDFQTILKYAIDDVIHHEMVCRRLGTAPEVPWSLPGQTDMLESKPEDIGGEPEHINFEDQDDVW